MHRLPFRIDRRQALDVSLVLLVFALVSQNVALVR